MTGYVVNIDGPTSSTIQVEFHDKTQRPMHFSDPYKYTIAALGDAGVGVACESTSSTPSVVHFRPFGTWATRGDWSIHLNQGENAQGKYLYSTIGSNNLNLRISIGIDKIFGCYCYRPILSSVLFI